MSLSGVGLYTIREAARLTKANPRELRRWLVGYKFKAANEEGSHFSAPLWEKQLGFEDAIGFHDLLEIRVVKEFVKHGVHLSVIRAALKVAKELFGADYPFTAHQFLTDGKRVFHEAVSSVNDPLTDLVAQQLVIDNVIRPSLYAGIEYGQRGKAERWFPIPRSRTVVLDPDLSFGAPTLAEFGIPVDTIAAAVMAEKNVGRVAQMYGISKAAVNASLKFEQHFAA
jgi:uncharacterized protein (DUF433 family)